MMPLATRQLVDRCTSIKPCAMARGSHNGAYWMWGLPGSATQRQSAYRALVMATEDAPTRFVRAMYELAVGSGSLSERVSAAWLELLPLRREDVPPALQEAYAAIEAEMLTAPDDPTALGDEQATAAAERIFRLAMELWGR
jgi:hypothetical protein